MSRTFGRFGGIPDRQEGYRTQIVSYADGGTHGVFVECAYPYARQAQCRDRQLRIGARDGRILHAEHFRAPFAVFFCVPLPVRNEGDQQGRLQDELLTMAS